MQIRRAYAEISCPVHIIDLGGKSSTILFKAQYENCDQVSVGYSLTDYQVLLRFGCPFLSESNNLVDFNSEKAAIELEFEVKVKLLFQKNCGVS